MTDTAARTAMRTTARALAWLLVVVVQALSFDALRSRALDAHIIHGQLLYGHVSEHMLAGAWALAVDILLWVGILSVRVDQQDWRAWLALGTGLACTFGNQVWALPPTALRAVPPVALAVALAVVEVPRRAAGPVGERGVRAAAARTPPTPVHDRAPHAGPEAVPDVPASVAVSRADREAVRRAWKTGDPARLEQVPADRPALDRATVQALAAGFARANGHRPKGDSTI